MTVETRERKLRSAAAAIGLKLIKGRARITGSPIGYMLLDARSGFHVFGGEYISYSASLAACERVVAEWSN